MGRARRCRARSPATTSSAEGSGEWRRGVHRSRPIRSIAARQLPKRATASRPRRVRKKSVAVSTGRFLTAARSSAISAASLRRSRRLRCITRAGSRLAARSAPSRSPKKRPHWPANRRDQHRHGRAGKVLHVLARCPLDPRQDLLPGPRAVIYPGLIVVEICKLDCSLPASAMPPRRGMQLARTLLAPSDAPGHSS